MNDHVETDVIEDQEPEAEEHGRAYIFEGGLALAHGDYMKERQ